MSVSGGRRHWGLGEMPLPARAGAIPGCGGRDPARRGQRGRPRPPRRGPSRSPSWGSAPGTGPGEGARSHRHTHRAAPVGRAVSAPLHRRGSAQPRRSGTQKGSFTQLRLKTFLEERRAGKTLCKTSLGSQKFSLALAVLRSAAGRPGLSPCDVPRGEGDSARGWKREQHSGEINHEMY